MNARIDAGFVLASNSVVQLRAHLTPDDLTKFLTALTPVRFEFAPEEERERYLVLQPPTSIALVPGAGLRVETSAWIRWSLAVFTVPIELPRVTVLLRPSVDESPTLDRGCLAFHVEIESIDVAKLPAFLDDALMAKLNSELAHRPLVWDFGKTLSHSFKLPSNLPPLEAIALQVAWGETAVDESGVSLVVSIGANVVRDPTRPADPRPPAD